MFLTADSYRSSVFCIWPVWSFKIKPEFPHFLLGKTVQGIIAKGFCLNVSQQRWQPWGSVALKQRGRPKTVSHCTISVCHNSLHLGRCSVMEVKRNHHSAQHPHSACVFLSTLPISSIHSTFVHSMHITLHTFSDNLSPPCMLTYL